MAPVQATVSWWRTFLTFLTTTLSLPTLLLLLLITSPETPQTPPPSPSSTAAAILPLYPAANRPISPPISEAGISTKSPSPVTSAFRTTI
ncbi:hypothetical protein RchiOBHm_Chr6g0306441 [Rosa chinensis]|uniref:Uncharacterized protein n=1 Tax=Rosa chinensis TaxID=74649 RepID=A0A2P6Q054_ROSCH|nr:hypothetical protein RchiOBHm_Chr6g0306441 [Rosa chinensis]